MPSLAGKLLRQTASIALETKSPLAIAAGLLWEPACWRFRACGPHAIACRQAPTADSIHRFGNKEPAGDSCRSFVGASLLAIQGLVVRMPSLAGKLLQQTAFIACRQAPTADSIHRLLASPHNRQHSSLAGKHVQGQLMSARALAPRPHPCVCQSAPGLRASWRPRCSHRRCRLRGPGQSPSRLRQSHPDRARSRPRCDRR